MAITKKLDIVQKGRYSKNLNIKASGLEANPAIGSAFILRNLISLLMNISPPKKYLKQS